MVQTPDEWTILSMLEWGTHYLEERGISNSRLSMEWLLADVLKVKRLDLYLKFDRPLSGAELSDLKPLLMRRSRHEPLQYITGQTDFINARITVTPDVLIPRPETEQLAQLVLEHFDSGTTIDFIDAGTGSGCIPIALKKERPSWTARAFDISEAALEIARSNAVANNVEVTFFRADLTDQSTVTDIVKKRVDLFISNPPYIPPDEKSTLDPEVKNYEPELALFHNDPVRLYRQLISTAREVLGAGGMIFLEIHEDFGEQIRSLFDGVKWQTELLKDYNKKNRFITATLL